MLNYPPWDSEMEPDEANFKIWADNLYGRYEPIEQARWNQSNIDTLFNAGEQRFINSYFNFYPTYNAQTFHFNLVQQPVNMVCGYQRQHRKSINFLPLQAAKQDFADDLTKVITYANTNRGILEKYSTGCEQSCVSGMVLAQPYLDYTDDPVNGTLDLKIWSYNSFMIDPYFREPDASDANFIWCQQYLSKKAAMDKFPDKADIIKNMSGFGNRYGKFYFLPENYALARNDLLINSYIWYRSKRKKKMLYNANDGIAYDYVGGDKNMDQLVSRSEFFEIIEIDVPTWKLAVAVNDVLMFKGVNPMGFDECPLVPIMWNYDPHISQYDLRVRSLVRSMRDAQFLMNRRIILNHDISESSINSGWIRKENAVVNEEELRYAGQGKDIIIKEGNELTDVQKIIPNAVPPSDMQLADQLADLIFRTSGVNQELLGMANVAISGLEVMLRQGAGLITLQKYFDQWDTSLKLIGKLEQKIIQNKWSPAKIAMILGKEPNVEFQNKTFSQYDVAVAEGLNTTIQQQQEAIQIGQLNQVLGGIIPAKFIIQKSTIQGKKEIIAAIEEQQAQQAEMQKQQMLIEQAKLQADLQKTHAESVSQLATARERHGRAEANIGLFEERISEITRNRALALKDKVDALKGLLELYQQHGELEAKFKMEQLEQLEGKEKIGEDIEKAHSQATADSNNFLTSLMNNNNPNSTMQNQQPAEQNAAPIGAL